MGLNEMSLPYIRVENETLMNRYTQYATSNPLALLVTSALFIPHACRNPKPLMK